MSSTSKVSIPAIISALEMFSTSSEELDIFISLKPFDFLTENFLAGKKTPDEKDFPPPAFFILSSEEKEKISGSIPKNAAVSNYIPEFLKKSEYCNLKDWNYNTIAQTARKFDLLRKNHSELDSVKFFDFLLKGGLQGAVYYSDCLEARGKKQGKK